MHTMLGLCIYRQVESLQAPELPKPLLVGTRTAHVKCDLHVLIQRTERKHGLPRQEDGHAVAGSLSG